MHRNQHLVSLGLGLSMLGALGCSSQRAFPTPKATHHPLTKPVDYSWVYQAFQGHPFLEILSVDQRDRTLPGKALTELRLSVMEPEMNVRKEVERIHRLLVAPDQRLVQMTYVLRGLGDTEWGILVGYWQQGQTSIRWEHPEGPEGAR